MCHVLDKLNINMSVFDRNQAHGCGENQRSTTLSCIHFLIFRNNEHFPWEKYF